MFDKRIVLTAFGSLVLGVGSANAAVLIDANTQNGSFELLGGVQSTAKATHWDTDPDGDVDNWTVWDAAAGGPSVAENDSGTDTVSAGGTATHGTQVAFLQPGNAAYNATSHVVAVGEVFTYSWDWVTPGRGDATAGLAYESAAGVWTTIAGTETSAGATVGTYGTSYTALAGDAAIGNRIALTVVSGGSWPEVDNFVLTAVPEPGSLALLSLGGLAVLRRRRA